MVRRSDSSSHGGNGRGSRKLLQCGVGTMNMVSPSVGALGNCQREKESESGIYLGMVGQLTAKRQLVPLVAELICVGEWEIVQKDSVRE